jgi:hypothetical protein
MGVRHPKSHGTPTPTVLGAIDVAIFANAGATTGTVVDVADEVTVAEGTAVPPTVWGVIANAGAGDVLLKNGSDVGSVWSVGPVILAAGTGSTTTVHGSVRSGQSVTVPGGAIVSPGPTLTNQTINLGLINISVTFPSPPTDIVHNTNTTLTLPQGAYGNVSINMGTLSLSPGTYTFESLTLETGTTFLGNNAGGPLLINIRGAFICRAAMTNATNPLNTRFAVFGTAGATLQAGSTLSMFRGTVVAMNGPLLIQQTRTYRGAFFGRTVTLGTGVTIQHQGFTGWEAPSP